jgi:hypothetical protein
MSRMNNMVRKIFQKHCVTEKAYFYFYLYLSFYFVEYQ